jgi:glycine cleavage system H lipoate-binding protein
VAWILTKWQVSEFKFPVSQKSMKMRPQKMLLTLLTLPFFSFAFGAFTEEEPANPTLKISCSPVLEDLGNQWADEFSARHPEARIQMLPVLETGLEDLIREEGALGLVLKDELSTLRSDQTRIIVVGKDVVVPVMSELHPSREQILTKGISPKAFSRAFSGHSSQGLQIHPVWSGEPAIDGFLSDFLQLETDQLKGRKTGGWKETLAYIQTHPDAIGFCRLTEVLDESGQALQAGLKLVPLDVNGTSSIEPLEDIYRSAKDLRHGIWIGKYPRTLYSRIYAVTGPDPLSPVETSFLQWMISEGQEQLSSCKYLPVSTGEKHRAEQLLAADAHAVSDVKAADSSLSVSLLILGVLSVLFLSLWGLPRLAGKERKVDILDSGTRPLVGVTAGNIPGGLLFDRTHTWVFMEKDGQVRVGINDFLQKVTGSITRVKLKQTGDRIKKGETFLTLVQHGKKLEIQSPVSGVIVEPNTELHTDSSLINSAPYEDGWVYMVEPADWIREQKFFVMGEQYISWIRKELLRLKDFLSMTGTLPGENILTGVYQDGGEISEGVLEGFGPELWEEFQSRFIHQEN